MSNKDTGGSAFPRTAFDQNGELTTWDDDFKGMTLRDYFAAKAMQAWLTDAGRGEENFDKDCLFEAKLAYRMADAMLEARNK